MTDRAPNREQPDFQKAREAYRQLYEDWMQARRVHLLPLLDMQATLHAAEALVAFQSSEIAELRQDAERWRAVRDDLAVDGEYVEGRWRIVGNEYSPYPGPPPANIDEAADRLIELASRASGTTQEKQG